MKIAIVHSETPRSMAVVTELMTLIQSTSIEVDETNPEVVVAVGGDGTLLKAMHQFQSILPTVRFAGIHTGHLGFYADWRDFEVVEFVQKLQNDQGERVTYPLLETSFKKSDGTVQKQLSLNDMTLRKINGTMICEVFVNNELFEVFRGDGLCISTPTGSTAENKSLGGAVVHPSTEVLQLTEMASINNRVFRTLSSPMILAKNDTILLKPHNREGLVVSYDHLSIEANEMIEMECHIAQQKISFVAYRHKDFWSRVEKAFIGAKQFNEMNE